jgi:plasmid stabilization system protein ParE
MYSAALRFYRDSESGRVASDFEREIRRCVELLLHNPEMAPRFGLTAARGKLLRRFPNALVYVVEDEVISILAVAHQSRRPGSPSCSTTSGSGERRYVCPVEREIRVSV